MAYENLERLSTRELKRARLQTPERGYPPIANRLYIPPGTWEKMVKRQEIVIPEGPWSISDHPNRRGQSKHLLDAIATASNPMDAARVQQWQRLGLLVDTAGRPLHPRAKQLLTTAGVGMFTQPGFHYKYGPQRLGNLGLRKQRAGIVEYAVVAVQRSTVKWSLPGGYANPQETTLDAAFREGFEEAGIERKMLGKIATRELFSPPKGFKRDTLHAWGEEWFTFVTSKDNPGMEGINLRPRDTAEVIAATWMGLAEIERRPDFITTHRNMILAQEGRL
jgi:ADP-ribose pyrophosphatase YjhB (NUDIX family)